MQAQQVQADARRAERAKGEHDGQAPQAQAEAQETKIMSDTVGVRGSTRLESQRQQILKLASHAGSIESKSVGYKSLQPIAEESLNGEQDDAKRVKIDQGDEEWRDDCRQRCLRTLIAEQAQSDIRRPNSSCRTTQGDPNM